MFISLVIAKLPHSPPTSANNQLAPSPRVTHLLKTDPSRSPVYHLQTLIIHKVSCTQIPIHESSRLIPLAVTNISSSFMHLPITIYSLSCLLITYLAPFFCPAPCICNLISLSNQPICQPCLFFILQTSLHSLSCSCITYLAHIFNLAPYINYLNSLSIIS